MIPKQKSGAVWPLVVTPGQAARVKVGDWREGADQEAGGQEEDAGRDTAEPASMMTGRVVPRTFPGVGRGPQRYRWQ